MKSNFKKLVLIFLLAFVLNFFWEEFHSRFYVHYRGGEITHLVLLRAAVFDATFTTVLGVLFLSVRFLRKRLCLVFILATIFAVGLEMFALHTGRWEYNTMMPIVPLLGVGLTPSIQLGTLAYISFKLVKLNR